MLTLHRSDAGQHSEVPERAGIPQKSWTSDSHHSNMCQCKTIVEHYKRFFETVNFFLTNKKAKLDLNWECNILLNSESSALTATPQYHQQQPCLYQVRYDSFITSCPP